MTLNCLRRIGPSGDNSLDALATGPTLSKSRSYLDVAPSTRTGPIFRRVRALQEGQTIVYLFFEIAPLTRVPVRTPRPLSPGSWRARPSIRLFRLALPFPTITPPTHIGEFESTRVLPEFLTLTEE